MSATVDSRHLENIHCRYSVMSAGDPIAAIAAAYKRTSRPRFSTRPLGTNHISQRDAAAGDE